VTNSVTSTSRIPAGLVRDVRERLAAEQRIDRQVPGGRLYIDRPLPFLCMYRGGDPATRQLVQSEGSWLVVSADPELQPAVAELVEASLGCLADRFGSVLLLEVWTAPADADDCFEVTASELTDAVEGLRDNLRQIRFAGRRLDAVAGTGRPAPPGLEPLLGADEVRKLGCLHAGLAVPPVFLDPRTGNRLPEPLRRFRRELSRAMQRSFHAFAQVQTSYSPEHYRTLGRRAVSDTTWEVDRRLADLGASFDFLLAVSPVNTQEAWEEFESSRYQREPGFHYRLLDVDPERLKRALYEVPIEAVPDPTLAYLLRDKRAELDRQITLLSDRETDRFLPGSVALYGDVNDALLDLAERILAGIGPTVGPASAEVAVDAETFAGAARAELDRYRAAHPSVATAGVAVRDDVPSLIVSGATLLVSSAYQVRPERVDALVQHEIGTHVLTFLNGAAQPLRLLGGGLAGYEQLQEGLAVFAEWLVGGLTAARLRMLAGRVIGVRRLQEGGGFVDTFHELHGYGFSAYQAFSVTARVFRSGGLTKDAVYLRGLADLLGYLAAGGDPGILTIGKLHLDQVPLIEELRWRQVLHPPPLTPAWLERPDALERLQQAQGGIDVLDLIEGQRA
jgi:uncharacterized protein (TIGR02421 family)